MSAAPEAMKITYRYLPNVMRERLRERLDRVAQLRCAEHGHPIVAVAMHGRANGWLDTVRPPAALRSTLRRERS